MNKKEKSCGIIPVLRKAGETYKFLVLRQTDGHWSFPKGHVEEGEKTKETALRELEEETGITEIEFLELPSVTCSYTFERNGEKYDKTVELFIAMVKNDKIVTQESEIDEYKWATYEESLNLLNFESSKEVLREAQKYLQNGFPK